MLADALSRCYPAFVRSPHAGHQQNPPRVAPIRVHELTKISNDDLLEVVKERVDKTVPEEGQRRQQLLEQAHAAGHFGGEHVFTHVWQMGYYWPTLRAECAELVGACEQCLRYNIGKKSFHPQHSIHAEFPFDHIAIDNFHMSMTSPRGHNYVLVVVDVATRFVLLYPLQDEKAATIAQRLWECVCTFGVPKVIQSDNGTGFVNQVVGSLLQLVGSDHRLVAPYNPRANGAAERHVQTVKQAVLKMCEGNMRDFDLFLPAAQWAINAKTARRTGCAPFSLMFARPPNPLRDYREEESFLLTEEKIMGRNRAMLGIVYPEIGRRVQEELERGDRRKDAQRTTIITDLEDGDRVMIRDVTRSSKDEPRWVGPYIVNAKVGSGSYRLRTTLGKELKRIVPRDQIKVIENTQADQDREPTYLVESILDHRRNARGYFEYLVKWKYYSAAENSWEPATSFEDVGWIRHYWQKRHLEDGSESEDEDAEEDDHSDVSDDGTQGAREQKEQKEANTDDSEERTQEEDRDDDNKDTDYNHTLSYKDRGGDKRRINRPVRFR